MTDKTSKNYLCATELGLLVLPYTPRDHAACLAILDLDIPQHETVSTAKVPWQDDSRWSLRETPARRQLFVLVNDVGPFETALSLMTLQKGFELFLACPDPDTASPNRIARLRQASAIILSIEDALDELNLDGGT